MEFNHVTLQSSFTGSEVLKTGQTTPIPSKTEIAITGIGTTAMQDIDKATNQAPTVLHNPFSKTAENEQFRHECREKCKAVGNELCNGTVEVNLNGIKFIAPKDPEEMDKLYKKLKAQIAEMFHIDESEVHKKLAQMWMNTSDNIPELLKDANALLPIFLTFFKKIAAENNAEANCGPNDKYAVKSLESLERKINDSLNKSTTSAAPLSKEQCVQQAWDTLRGSIIVQRPEDITGICHDLQKNCSERGWDVNFKNLWIDDRPSGYSAVHAIIKAKTDDGKTVLIEVQVHLKEIYDGTEKCFKEYSHEAYEIARSQITQVALGVLDQLHPETPAKPMSPATANEISKLVYLVSFLEVLEALKKQT